MRSKDADRRRAMDELDQIIIDALVTREVFRQGIMRKAEGAISVTEQELRSVEAHIRDQRIKYRALQLGRA